MQSYSFLGLPQEQWDFINSFSGWLAAVGTIAAVCVSLWLARNATRPKARLNANMVITIGAGLPSNEFLNFSIVNTGDRPIRITNIGWKSGVFKKRFAIQLTGQSPEMSSPIPVDLSHGQTGNWFVDTDHKFNGDTWAEHFGPKMIAPNLRSGLWSLRAQAYTSTGHIFSVKPSSDVLKMLRKACEDFEAKRMKVD
ncbi:hypothetical protein [Arenimonas alkanexedens]